MPSTITKLVFRRGMRLTGQTVILNEGEPGWYTDTKRLYVGDNIRVGGVPVGMKNYGYQNFNTLNFTTQLSGAETGDIIYDDVSNLLYFLTGTNGSAQNQWAPIDFIIKVDNSTVEFNTSSALQVKNYGIQPIHINSTNVGSGLVGGAGTAISVSVDNSTIEIDSNKVRLKPGSVPVSYLGSINQFSILGNTNNFTAPIEQIGMSNGKVVGMFSNVLGPIDFQTVVQYGGGIGTLVTSNGILGSITPGTPATIDISYDTGIIDTTTSTTIELKRNTNVTGTLQTTSNVIAGGLIRAGGDIIAFSSSDERLKENISEISNSLDKVNTLRGVEFDWKENYHFSGHDVGIIAQEVQKVLPEAITNRVDGYLAVRYEKLVPLLINSIKELKKEIDLLKNEVRKV